MQSGWLVTVAGKSDGIDRSVEAYVVAEPDPGKALDLLNAVVALPAEKVLGVVALQPTTVAALGVQEGAIAQFR